MSAPALQGLRPWIYQRLTAVYIALYLFYLVYAWFTAEAVGFEPWRAWVTTPLNQIAFALFYFAVLLHAWVGIRDVLLDYVKHFVLRLLLLFTMALVLIGSGVWVLKILLMVNPS